MKKIVFVFVLICSIVFLIFYYNFFILGNNININENEFVEDILNNLEEYEANIEVTVYSNKTENHYDMFQQVKDNFSKVTINSPQNIKGMTIELENNTLKITNTKINMEQIYNDYEEILNNSLFLNTFVEDYKVNNSNCNEKDEELIYKIKMENSNNTYIKFKELYVDKKSKRPNKLIIKDNTENTRICIIYNDIKIK